jgi:AcrR family transcriptional regulator
MAGSKRSAQGLGDALDEISRRYFRREPKQSRSRALVDAVVEATDELIRRGAPLDQVTVEVVSERAGIATGSFYEYFAGKDSVLGILIGKITRVNFEELSRQLDALECDSLDALTHAFAASVVDTYLAHPNQTRVIVEGIGRLGLTTLVREEKDRFAEVIAIRAAAFLPDEPLDAVTATMRVVSDAVMGVLIFSAMRGGPIERAAIADEIAALGLAIIYRRHPHHRDPAAACEEAR